MKDLYHNVGAEILSLPATRTSTVTSGNADLQGYNSAMVMFAVGVSGDTLSGSVYWTLKIQHSDDGSDFSDATTADLNNTAATLVIDAAAEDEVVHSFGYVGNKRYLRGIATATGTHSTGTPMTILALKAKAALAPVA